MSLIQSKPAALATSITGGDLGPGTRAMLRVDVTFDNPVTAGSTVLLAVSGRVIYPGQVLWLGPPCAFVFSSGGTGPPTTNYDVQFTFTDASGFETMPGPVTTVALDSGATLVCSRPNPNLSIIPNAVSYSVYVDGAKVATLPPNMDYAGSPSGGGAPPTSPVHDSTGAVYSQLFWLDGGAAGTQNGVPAMGWFASENVPGGACTISFVCGCLNGNPFLGAQADLNIVAMEYPTMPALSVADVEEVQQSNSSGSLNVTVASPGYGAVTTAYGTLAQCAASVLDFLSDKEYFFALATGDGLPNPATTPTVSPVLAPLAYGLIDHIVGAGGFPLWVWSLEATLVSTLIVACGSPPIGLVGDAYTYTFPISGGTGVFTVVITGLPPGMTYDPATGTIAGVPLTGGVVTVTITVTDSAGHTATATCTLRFRRFENVAA